MTVRLGAPDRRARLRGTPDGADAERVARFRAAAAPAREGRPRPMPGRIFEAADPGLARVAGLHDTGMRCLHDGQVAHLLADSLRAAMDITRAHAGSMHLLNLETDQLELAAHRGMPSDVVRLSGSGDGQAVCRAAIDEGAQIVVDDISTSSRYADSTRVALLEADAAACQSTPLVTRTGDRIGVCSTFFRTRGGPTDRELQLLDVIARHTADFISQTREHDALRQRSARESDVREAAEATSRRKDQFLAMLSHELRQPLSAALAALELHKGKPAAADAHAVEVIERQLQQIARLIEDLSDLVRIGRGTLELRRERLDLRDVIRHALDMTQAQFDARLHRLTVALGDEPVWMLADAARMKQVFSNLLQNAASYTAPGGEIAVTLSRAGGTVTVTVQDNGMGIPAAALGRIFELFERGADDARGFSLGIGLSVVRPVVDLHGGTVSAYSDGPGTGSRFVVTLPADA